MAKWLKIIAVSLSALLSGITSFATAEESYEQRIEKLEDLLEIYFEENRQLKQKVSDLENKLESFDKAASAKPKTIREKCEADINGCSDENVCAIATRTKDSVKKWKLGNKFFYEAKRRGLTCGVKLGSNKLTAKQRCEANIRGCSETALCEVATYTTYNNKKEWARGNSFVKFATEAKRRGLTCGVKEESNYLTAFKNAKKKCEKNIQTCSTTDICLLATYKVEDGYRWLSGASSTYVSEAKRRGLTCGVKSASNTSTQTVTPKVSITTTTAKQRCEANIRGCSEADLCETATYGTTEKNWSATYIRFVDEAKRRGLTCGVVETTVRPKSTSPKISDNRDRSIPKDCTSLHLQLAKDVWESVLSTQQLSWHQVEKLIAWCNQFNNFWFVKFGGSGASAPTIIWDGTRYIEFAGQGISSKTVQCVDRTTLSYTNRTPNWSGSMCK